MQYVDTKFLNQSKMYMGIATFLCLVPNDSDGKVTTNELYYILYGLALKFWKRQALLWFAI